jgi:hypothetical protein
MDNIKMISEFMKGYDFEHIDGGLPLGDFSNSWDWLMPVVKKCNSIRNEVLSYPTDVEDYWEDIHNSLEELDVYWTFKKCVVFIKWYNKNQIK